MFRLCSACVQGGSDRQDIPFPRFLSDSSLLYSPSPQIPEYCRVLEESEISEHCFDLIFAFDEIVALGYRENVNLAQIRTFTEMDSHEEKVFRAVREVRPLAVSKAPSSRRGRFLAVRGGGS